MTNEILMILSGGMAAVVVCDVIRVAGKAASFAGAGLHLRAADDHGAAPPRVQRKEGGQPASAGHRLSIPPILVYLVGVISPLFGLGLAVHPLI